MFNRNKCKGGTHYFKAGNSTCQCGRDRLQPHEVQQAPRRQAHPQQPKRKPLFSFDWGRSYDDDIVEGGTKFGLNMGNHEDRIAAQTRNEMEQTAADAPRARQFSDRHKPR